MDEGENEELPLPTQVQDTGEPMDEGENDWQSAVPSLHDGGDYSFKTASFQSLQDHDVKGQQRLGLQMMDSGQGSIAETVLRSPTQEALVINPASALPPPEVQQSLALNTFNQHGQYKAFPPLSDDEIDLHSFNVSGRVGRPKDERSAELLISNVMPGVKRGISNCAVAFDSDISIDHVPFKEEQFEKLPKKGEGVSSFVTAYKDKSGNRFVRKHLKDGTKLREQEIMSLIKLKHPNICKLFAVIFYLGSVDIIMQDGGQPLDTFIEKLQNRPESRASSWYYGVVQDLACQGFQALHYMHKHSLYHLDIKPDNILVDSTSENQFHLTLADFGSSMTGNQLMSLSMHLTPAYCAPELWQRFKADDNRFQEKQFSPQASFDIYAKGLAVYFMCTRRHLPEFLEQLKGNGRQTFDDFMAQLMTEQAHCIAGWATQGPFVYDEPLPQILQELLKNTLHPDPEKRWTASQAVEGLSVIDEDPKEEESENEELQLPTQVFDTVSVYTCEPMDVEENVWQSAVPSLHDRGDHDVKGQQRLGQLVRNVQPSQDVTFQASKHELVTGAPTNLPTTFRQSVVAPEAKQHMVLATYCPVQLNNSFALMEVDEVSHAADQWS